MFSIGQLPSLTPESVPTPQRPADPTILIWWCVSLFLIANRQTPVVNDITGYNHIVPFYFYSLNFTRLHLLLFCDFVHSELVLAGAQVVFVSDALSIADFFNAILVFAEEGLERRSVKATKFLVL